MLWTHRSRPPISTEGAGIGILLEKWYLDCVSPEGEVLIGYAAKLRWGPVKLGYGARIECPDDQLLSQRQSLAFGRLDERSDGVTWCNEQLGVAGTWSGGAHIGATVVVEEPSGTVVWQCLGTNCAVDVALDGRHVTGTGYAEKLSMTIAPWRLPFTELRWGRYISADRRDYVVWIDLLGRAETNWIWVNSDQALTGIVDESGVRTDSAKLTFESSRPLRSENVARTLLGGYARILGAMLPRGLRSIQEDKQLSSCTFVADDRESKGFSINEVVTWG